MDGGKLVLYRASTTGGSSGIALLRAHLASRQAVQVDTEETGNVGQREAPGSRDSSLHTPGVTEVALDSVLELLLEQQQVQQEQQKMLMTLLEQQRDELAQHRLEMAELRARRETPDGGGEVRLPKPTLQKLGPEDDIEHFLSTFERIATQQGWATQLVGLLTRKALAAYAGLSGNKAASYNEVKAEVLHHFEVSEETY